MPYASCMKSKCWSAVRFCLGGKYSITSACFPFFRVISETLLLVQQNTGAQLQLQRKRIHISDFDEIGFYLLPLSGFH